MCGEGGLELLTDRDFNNLFRQPGKNLVRGRIRGDNRWAGVTRYQEDEQGRHDHRDLRTCTRAQQLDAKIIEYITTILSFS